MAALPLDRHHWHGDWNYTLRPAASATGPASATRRNPNAQTGPAPP